MPFWLGFTVMPTAPVEASVLVSLNPALTPIPSFLLRVTSTLAPIFHPQEKV